MKLFQNRRRPSEASSWFEKIRAGQVDEAGSDSFVKWMDAGAENMNAYEEREMAWHLAGQLQGRRTFDSLLADADRILESGRSPGWRDWFRIPHLRVAALVAVPVVGLLVFGISMLARTEVAHFETGVGETRLVVLADQSTIHLNSSTKVDVSYSRRLRSITLLEGEALFSVAHNVDRPFEVQAAHGTTRAVGTRFDVNLRPRGIEVSVLEGAVDVLVPLRAAKDPGVRVKGGESVVYTAAGAVTEPSLLDPNRISGWQLGKIVLSHATLVEAIEENNRYNKMPIHLEATQFADRQVSGIFKVGDQDAFVAALERALPLHAVREADRILLRQRSGTEGARNP